MSLPVAPRLQLADIEQELKKIYRGSHRTHLVALFGAGEPGAVAAYGHEYQVVPTRCELDLRAAMPPVERDYNPGRVFLVDWAEQLPLDLSSRLAGQRLHHLSGLARLATLFGARQVDAALQGTAIARVLLGGHGQEWHARLGRLSGPVLRKDEALWQFLQAYLDAPPPREPGVADLLGMAVLDGQGRGFAERMAADGTWAQLGAELEAFFAERAGAAGRLAWQAWLRGAGEELVEHLVLVDALREHLGQGHYAEGWLASELARPGDEWKQAVTEAAGALEADVLRDVVRILDEAAPETRPGQVLLARADRRLTDPALRQAAVGSRLLPAAHEELTAKLAEHLQRAATEQPPGETTLEALDYTERALREHLHDATVRERDRLRRQMAVRLAHYLAERSAAAAAAADADTDAEHRPVAQPGTLAIADRYVKEGGHVDWARRLLRGTEAYRLLGPAYAALVARVDAHRREDDRRFAESLVEWIAAGSPAHQVLPITEVSRRVVAEFLGGNEHRRLLVLLMDGMSWANAIELVTNITGETGRWGPATWQPKGHKSRVAFLPPVIAALPSLTNISRAALFAGRLPKSGKLPASGDDPKRWASNRWAQKHSGDDAEPPVLLLKDLATREGGITVDAERLVASNRRLVALVINAIDDHLSGSDQIDLQYTAEQIHPLGAILDAAMAAERAVLLISDHGHVPGQPMRPAGERPRTGGARWRALDPGDTPAEFEVALPEQGTWWPTAATRVAAIWDETRCYGPSKAGKHGGASLAEVVAPAILLVPETLATWVADQDPDLNALALPTPNWWSYDAPKARLLADLKPKPKPKPKRKKKPTPDPGPQLSLLDPVQEPEPEPHSEPHSELHPEPHPEPELEPHPAPQRELHPKPHSAQATIQHALPDLVRQLEASPIFRDHVAEMPPERIDKALKSLALLIEAGDHIGIEPFARLSKIPAWRVPGFISAELSPVLNRDGYSVVEYDRQGKQIVLSRERLQQIYMFG